MMRFKYKFASALMLGGLATAVSLASDPGTAFTYQGQLKQNGSPVTGSHTLNFQLFDVETGGSHLGNTITKLVTLSAGDAGLFTVSLNEAGEFGALAFNGQARWLEVTVDGNLLSPRQEITPAPLALALPGLYTVQTAGTPNVVGGYSGNTMDTPVHGGTIGGGGGLAGNENHVYGSYSTISGGMHNAAGFYNGTYEAMLATVGGGAYNTASGYAAAIGGGSGGVADGRWSTILGATATRRAPITRLPLVCALRPSIKAASSGRTRHKVMSASSPPAESTNS